MKPKIMKENKGSLRKQKLSYISAKNISTQWFRQVGC